MRPAFAPLITRAQAPAAGAIRRIGPCQAVGACLPLSSSTNSIPCGRSAGSRAEPRDRATLHRRPCRAAATILGRARSAEGRADRDQRHRCCAGGDATTTIPIILWGTGDPVRAGLVETLARPGGNVTGMAIVSTELDAKRLSLLREPVPAARYAVGCALLNSTDPSSAMRKTDIERMYPTVGLQPIVIEVAAGKDIEPAIADMSRQRAEALVVSSNGLFYVTAMLS